VSEASEQQAKTEQQANNNKECAPKINNKNRK
jgi:hypothetical protein